MTGASAADWAGVIIAGITAAVAIATAILAVISYRARTADQRRQAEAQAARDLHLAFDHLGTAPYDPGSKAQFEKLLLGAELLAPGSAMVLRYRGLWFEDILGDRAGAHEMYKAALLVADEPGELHRDIARTSLDPEERVRHLTEATANARTACRAYLDLANHYRSEDGGPDLAKAEETALEAVRRGAKVSAVWSELAEICRRKGEAQRSLEYRREAVRTADRAQVAGKLADLGSALVALGVPQRFLAAIAADEANGAGGRRAERLAEAAVAWAREALAIQPEDEDMRTLIEDMDGILDPPR
jgi:tetratricopeptide (TPR) repeat protein